MVTMLLFMDMTDLVTSDLPDNGLALSIYAGGRRGEIIEEELMPGGARGWPSSQGPCSIFFFLYHRIEEAIAHGVSTRGVCGKPLFTIYTLFSIPSVSCALKSHPGSGRCVQ